jgi:hypothetical protein
MMDLATIQEVNSVRATLRQIVRVRRDLPGRRQQCGDYATLSMIVRADTDILRCVGYALTLELDESTRAYFTRIGEKVEADATETMEMMNLMDLMELQQDALLERAISGATLQ